LARKAAPFYGGFKHDLDPEQPEMTKTVEETNKALVLEAFATLFNQRDYKAAERFWSPNYIQHNAHIPPGREGLFDLIKSASPTLRYEHGVILADKEYSTEHRTALDSNQDGRPYSLEGFYCQVPFFSVRTTKTEEPRQ
jgi:hypothetical protein